MARLFFLTGVSPPRKPHSPSVVCAIYPTKAESLREISGFPEFFVPKIEDLRFFLTSRQVSHSFVKQPCKVVTWGASVLGYTWYISNVQGGPGGDGSFSDPSALASTGGFGFCNQTPDLARSNPVLGSGGPRAIQLGLKFIF